MLFVKDIAPLLLTTVGTGLVLLQHFLSLELTRRHRPLYSEVTLNEDLNALENARLNLVTDVKTKDSAMVCLKDNCISQLK